MAMNFMPNFYRPPMGIPLYWRDEMTGELPTAVNTYFKACAGEKVTLTQRQLDIIANYLQHYIGAPCWTKTMEGDEAMFGDYKELIARAHTLASVESIKRWIADAMELGLDPF